MLKNDQTYFNNLGVYAARLLKYVWPFFNIMHEKDKWFSKPFTALNLWRKIFFMIFNTRHVSIFFERYRTHYKQRT